MESEIRSWEQVEHFLDASVSPERLDVLITVWDTQIERSGLGHVRLANAAGSTFAGEIAGVLQVLEQLHTAELRRVNDLLSTMLGAAMVLAEDGTVVAANDAASGVFGLQPGGSIRSMPLGDAHLGEFAARLAEVAGGGEGILRLRPTGLDRAVLVHLKPMRNGSGPPRVLAVTTELPWPAEVSAFLERAFAVTAAELGVVRLVVAGGTVTGIAADSGRSPGTVRSQLRGFTGNPYNHLRWYQML